MEGHEGAGTHNSVTGGHIHGHVFQAASISIDTLTVERRRRLRPRQVPLPTRGFVNRLGELRELGKLSVESDVGEPARVVVLSGLGGVGKSQLVSQWAARQSCFTDGQLYADLADVRRDGGVDVAAVLETWLRALGEDKSEIGSSLAERAAAFRTLTAGLRLLVVVDNAQQAAEVRPLIPAAGAAVVTSRRPIPGLTMDGARPVPVGPLTAEAGVELFRGCLDDERGTHPALAELARLCAGLPLALRAVGTRLLERPQQNVPDLLAELVDEQRRLEILDGEPDGEGATMSAALDSAYDGLPEHSRAALRMLGVFPGVTFTPELLERAGLSGTDGALAGLLTGQLAVRAGAFAAGSESAQARYRLHDLVRLHARRRAVGEVASGERERLLGEFVDFYVDRTAAADRAVLHRRYRISDLSPRAHFADSATALDWLHAERANILDVLSAAHEAGLHDPVWRICESLWAFYHTRKHMADWIASHRLGIESAQWEGRTTAEIRLRNQLARAYMETGDHDRAEEELGRAAELLGFVDEPVLSGVIWETEALLRLAHGQPGEAVELFTAAREANERAKDAHGVIVQSYQLGQALLRAGRAQEAETVLTEALAGAVRTSDDPMRSRIGIVQGQVQRALGNVEEAARQTVNAAHWAARLGQRAKLKQALTSLGELAGDVADQDLAAGWRRRIAELRQDLDAVDDEADEDRADGRDGASAADTGGEPGGGQR
ncbi:tetratricopeptide repeat protein [Streptomyces sp. Amel2xB2]|uniref:NB-ARC domain-containing protein n=1 Tax=Streptomyces sp. Amel2xB2 TaxID=1305829 RepID=UPI000DBA0752|nr:NB-ARC domain-containing protein [Streptomyces sp. Amel2xB2]RAJ71749.1 tetratricopeptide repeat protein [Streptomyces sp. Amel2xB2]